jgi:hypothetical protein
VEIVVAEDGAHGDRQPAARVREHRRLLRLAVGRQVAGEQDEVGFFLGGMNGPTGDLVRMGCWRSEAAGSLEQCGFGRIAGSPFR